MVILYHKNNKIVELDSGGNKPIVFDHRSSISYCLLQLAKTHPTEILVWCHIDAKEQLNLSAIEKGLHHKKMLLSYTPSEVSFLDSAIGYVDTSLFVQINKKVSFPTWQMSSLVGCAHSEVFLALNDAIPLDKNFDYFLCSLGKLSMPKGIMCYSEPKILDNLPKFSPAKSRKYTLFRFVKQHYKTQWIFLLLLNLFLYERKFPLLPFLISLFYKNRNKSNINFDAIKVQSSKKMVDKGTVDVIIPTIGRKEYLYVVLKDFSRQTLLPKKIIIVEQNSEKGSRSELDYLTIEKWPFEIKHIFTHQAGACNARNLALEQTQSEWVFLADDDIRFGVDFIQKAFEKINKFCTKAVNFRCFQKGQKVSFRTVFQWGTFGSGCSFVATDCLKECEFNMGYEFGYGEDGDFGMQLRNQGIDVLYLPEPEILHLKAPIGGFRTKPVLQWQNDSVQPKPSPTVMLYNFLHNSSQQINSYKTILFFKYYKHQKIKNPILYYIHFQKQWSSSVFWAYKLKKTSNTDEFVWNR